MPSTESRAACRRRRLAAPLTLVACAAGGLGVPVAGARAAAPRVAPEQAVAFLYAPRAALIAPRQTAHRVAVVSPHRPITGERTVLPVLARRIDAHGARWLRVMLPGRPNGASGWIRERHTQLSDTFWHLNIDLRARTVTAYYDGRRQRSFRAVVGKPSTPTPAGRFFVEESLRMPADDPGGPYALALSARSDTLHSFDGGPGQIAVHGRDLLGGTLGAAQSHGCVRLADRAIEWLVGRLGPGTPVTIRSG